ncbi:pyruvate decarboxylase 1-like [Panicum miliaceum]|uniref:pyruvate decarboxylase n=1 Tax=Panicum miliaceum TaxID=4540 RepID=A0A3L6SM80_PANMI|nr:pyruvate decarboxylase 1-like [Panicum miliaceum]
MDTTIGSVLAATDAAPPAPSAPAPREATLGRHLARRLAEVGARDVFALPGDFNLTLLDELEADNDYGSNRILHHTIGLPDFTQELRCFQTVTCYQVTAQEVSTMLRWGQNSIIFLINNGGYTIEVEIHDGPYNVRTEEELKEALKAALGPKKDCLCFIEVIVHKDDTSKELLEWGSRVSAANSRPPNPQ